MRSILLRVRVRVRLQDMCRMHNHRRNRLTRKLTNPRPLLLLPPLRITKTHILRTATPPQHRRHTRPIPLGRPPHTHRLHPLLHHYRRRRRRCINTLYLSMPPLRTPTPTRTPRCRRLCTSPPRYRALAPSAPQRRRSRPRRRRLRRTCICCRLPRHGGRCPWVLGWA
ncbi:hypothetical protein BDZ97DRAFT_1848236 [Flammula alnicola]|nr:hypothetical protein BDZ97DRAFT_1848236 [Flammula alnicola]